MDQRIHSAIGGAVFSERHADVTAGFCDIWRVALKSENSIFFLAPGTTLMCGTFAI